MHRPAVASGSHQIVRRHNYVFGKAKQKKQGAVKPNVSYEASTIVGHPGANESKETDYE